MNHAFAVWTGKDRIIEEVTTLVIEPGSHNHLEFVRFEARVQEGLISMPFFDVEGHRGVFGYLMFGIAIIQTEKIGFMTVDNIHPKWYPPEYINYKCQSFHPKYPSDLCAVWCRKGAYIQSQVAQIPKAAITGVVLLPATPPTP